MKKTLITAALVASLSLVAVACDNDSDATEEPTAEPAAAEVENAEATMEAEAEDAEATMEADAEEDVADAEATMEADAEDAVEDAEE